MTEQDFYCLDTPFIIADMRVVKRNIDAMQKSADSFGCALRPHIKTHKSAAIARMQVDAGSAGITCAKTSEAEVFARNGIDDIFIAYPLVGRLKLERALAIQKTVKRLIVAADSIEGARAMSEFALSENAVFETRLEIDTGAGRTGVPINSLSDIGAELLKLKGIRLTGVYTFKSMILEHNVTNDAEAAGREEGRMIAAAAAELGKLGFDIRDISAGSTPTGLSVAATGLVNEIRPGTYVFYDWMTMREGACSEDDIAASVWATVVSVPEPGLAVVDAGSKMLAADVRLNSAPANLAGFARVAGRDDLILDRLNEEHGMIRSTGGDTGLTVGQRLRLIPAHICTAVNLQDRIYTWDGKNIGEITVDARGCVR